MNYCGKRGFGQINQEILNEILNENGNFKV